MGSTWSSEAFDPDDAGATFEAYFVPRNVFFMDFEEGTLPRHQELKRDGLLCRRTVSFHQLINGEMAGTLVVSRRWQSPRNPDISKQKKGTGEHLQAIRSYLTEHEEIKQVWLDFPCLPQRDKDEDDNVKEDVTPEDAEYVGTALKFVNLLYLYLPVLVLLDADYETRFWCNYETFLGTHEFDGTSLVGARRLRLEVRHVGSLAKNSEKVREMATDLLIAKWHDKSAGKALEILHSADIKVTNLSDKEEQLSRLSRLEKTLQHAHSRLKIQPPSPLGLDAASGDEARNERSKPIEAWIAATTLPEDWVKVPSQSRPGEFSYLNKVSGERVAALAQVFVRQAEEARRKSAEAGKMPEGWEKVPSQSRPGEFSYLNKASGERVATLALVDEREAAKGHAAGLQLLREALQFSSIDEAISKPGRASWPQNEQQANAPGQPGTGWWTGRASWCVGDRLQDSDSSQVRRLSSTSQAGSGNTLQQVVTHGRLSEIPERSVAQPEDLDQTRPAGLLPSALLQHGYEGLAQATPDAKLTTAPDIKGEVQRAQRESKPIAVEDLRGLLGTRPVAVETEWEIWSKSAQQWFPVIRFEGPLQDGLFKAYWNGASGPVHKEVDQLTGNNDFVTASSNESVRRKGKGAGIGAPPQVGGDQGPGTRAVPDDLDKTWYG